MGTLEMLGTKSLCVRRHGALALGHGDTWGTRALVWGHGEMWGAGALGPGLGGDMWGTGASAPRRRDTWGPLPHGGCRALGSAGPCRGDAGAAWGVRQGTPGTTRAPQPALAPSVTPSPCPSVPLSPSLRPPTPIRSHFSFCPAFSLRFLQSSRVSLLSLLSPSCSPP